MPLILILIAVARSEVGDISAWASFLGKLLVLGPVIGFAIGGAGAWAMSQMDRLTGIRMEYQALYGIGLVLAAYSAASAAGGDGFLGAFAAGVAIVVLNQDLCDCFLDFGETTSEMAMLFAFVLFGAVLSGILGEATLWSSILMAFLVVCIFRPAVLGAVLARANMSWEAHAFVSWFGLRGLNSLLLALLVVQAEIAESELLLATVGIVVLASVILHGATAVPVTAWYGRRAARETLAEERESTVVGLLSHDETQMPRVSVEELGELLSEAVPPLILDARSRSSYEQDRSHIPDDVRVLPDQVLEWAHERSEDRLIVAYCT